jgi:hypothetical protein
MNNVAETDLAEFDAAVNLKRQRLVFPINKVHVGANTFFTVLCAFGTLQGRLRILILTRFVHLASESLAAVELNQ